LALDASLPSLALFDSGTVFDTENLGLRDAVYSSAGNLLDSSPDGTMMIRNPSLGAVMDVMVWLRSLVGRAQYAAVCDRIDQRARMYMDDDKIEQVEAEMLKVPTIGAITVAVMARW
jgi:hypothetical protein